MKQDAVFLCKLYAFFHFVLYILGRLEANKVAKMNSQITMFSARDERPHKYTFLASFSDAISLLSLLFLHSAGNMES